MTGKKKKNDFNRVISLFSWCWWKDLWFLWWFDFLWKKYKKNNFNILWASDIIQNCCDSYKYNIWDHVICSDIKEIDAKKLPDTDIVIWWFPCQDFSLAWKRLWTNSDRWNLFLEMLRVVKEKTPKIFIAENVKWIISLNKWKTLEYIKNEFSLLWYKVEHYLLNASNYWVPQNRERVFIIGVQEEYNVSFNIPEFHNEKVNSFNAINELWWKEDDEKIYNHNQYSKAKKSKWQWNKPINKDKPAPTIRAEHHWNIEFHYNETRRLTVRECARLQSFPDNFIFQSSASANYKQVWNAVPPVLAWHIAQEIELMLNKINVMDSK